MEKIRIYVCKDGVFFYDELLRITDIFKIELSADGKTGMAAFTPPICECCGKVHTICYDLKEVDIEGITYCNFACTDWEYSPKGHK